MFPVPTILGAMLLSACTPDGPGHGDPKDDPTDRDTDTDTDTDTTDITDITDTTDTTDTTATLVRSASCAITQNNLRVSCDVTLAEDGAATLTLTAAGAPTRTFVSEGGAEHEILGWGLLPETTYDWSIGAWSGTVTTGSLPAALQAASIVTTGTSWGFDAVLHPMKCTGGTDYFVMIDGDGEIIWYEPNDVYGGGMDGYEWSQASLTVLSLRRDRFVEQHVSGALQMALDGKGLDFEHSLHHDAARWGAYRYLLFERQSQGTFDVDGIYVYEGDVLLGTFDLADHFDVPGSGAGDWSHANGLKVTDDGELILSLLNFDTVVGIDGDPASPTFLDLRWHAVGSASGLPDPDYAAIDGPRQGFDGQHNASRHGDALWLFDNRGEANSRATRFLMDPLAGTLTLDAEWSFDRTCANQGGAIPLEGGGVLATCANADEVWAFEEGQATPGWTLKASCGGGVGLDLTRAIPVFVE